MYILYIITAIALLLSFISNRQKTLIAIKTAFQKLYKITPAFITMMILISVVLFLVPDHIILRYLGNNELFTGVLLASLLGSITLMPGFIVFPLCGILLSKGVSYMVLAAFTTTLMMVGILTFPLEKEYFGVKVAVVRNIISLFIALTVALCIGFIFGEFV